MRINRRIHELIQATRDYFDAEAAYEREKLKPRDMAHFRDELRDALADVEKELEEAGKYPFTCRLCGGHEVIEILGDPSITDWVDEKPAVTSYACGTCGVLFVDKDKFDAYKKLTVELGEP